jgi:hypothetical protein
VRGDVGQRVAAHCDHVGHPVRLQRANSVVPAQQLGRVQGGRVRSWPVRALVRVRVPTWRCGGTRLFGNRW